MYTNKYMYKTSNSNKQTVYMCIAVGDPVIVLHNL